MKVVFMGTPDFAVPALRRLIKEHKVVCVYTREPKISGRGNKLNKTPVHLVAEEFGIEVRTPKTLRTPEEQQKFADLRADVAVVAAYGLILPKVVLEAYPLGCLNLHASLLPRWRGAAPIQRCIEAGDNKSGVTIMQIAEGLDTGDMLLKGEVSINEETTGGELHDALANIGADLISEVLTDIKKYPPQKQDDNLACYAQKLEKDECKIDFNMPTIQLYNKIRAFSPYPAMYFEYEGERFKILQAEKALAKAPAGTIISTTDNLIIATADCALKITQIQRQGKRPMTTDELLRGFCFKENYLI
ncbi:MAG: methionyl-tRNA formyltransferase, partial [Alphaproteobacteria bacterium]|nr:methionyl-tRNA formyltransferase [Alphaproteobacteria bacterium]